MEVSMSSEQEIKDSRPGVINSERSRHGKMTGQYPISNMFRANESYKHDDALPKLKLTLPEYGFIICVSGKYKSWHRFCMSSLETVSWKKWAAPTPYRGLESELISLSRMMRHTMRSEDEIKREGSLESKN